MASLLLYHQENKDLRLPWVLSFEQKSFSYQVSQQSSRDHYKHRDAKPGLYDMPLVLTDPHVRSFSFPHLWQMWTYLHCNSGVHCWNNIQTDCLLKEKETRNSSHLPDALEIRLDLILWFAVDLEQNWWSCRTEIHKKQLANHYVWRRLYYQKLNNKYILQVFLTLLMKYERF